MVTFAQAQERAEEWVNGDVPAYQHREVRVREFELGFVVWAEDRADGPTSDGGRQRLVIARDSGEATLWPGLPVGEVIRRYEEEYGTPDVAAAPVVAQPERIDLNQTSFLLSPPEWLQDAADKLGIADQRAGAGAGAGAGASAAAPSAGADVSGGGTAGRGSHVGGDAWPGSAAPASVPTPEASPAPAAGGPSQGAPTAGTGADPSSAAPVPSVPAPSTPAAGWPAAGRGDYEPTASDGVPAAPGQGTPWAGTDTNASAEDGSVPLPATVFAPPLAGSDEDDTPPPSVGADAPTALMSGGSQLPHTAVAPVLDPQVPGPQAPGPQPSGPQPSAGDIADAATSKAALPPRASRGGGPTTPP
ncbi:SUKH-4 family immunity protein, partial [Streptomyces sp. NPDC054841]